MSDPKEQPTEADKLKDVSAIDLFDGWEQSLMEMVPPVMFKVGDGELSRLEVAPFQIMLFGGKPGDGKTALVNQLVVDALRLQPDLRAVVCNVEMPPHVLLDRQLSRISGVPAAIIRKRAFLPQHWERLTPAMTTIKDIAPRIKFVRSSYSISHIADVARDFDAQLVSVDYLQRIEPPYHCASAKESTTATMSALRRIADRGSAVIAVSAVSRGRDAMGRPSYDAGAGLASFRESSEIEYGADDAFMLARNGDNVTLLDLKSRHRPKYDIRLRFNASVLSFTSAEPKSEAA
jgi:replicative DNA helicase